MIPVVLYAGTLSTRGIVEAQADGWFILPQLPAFLIFLLAGVAETNRAPFDLPEAETELVAGYHTEYSGIKFLMFFMAEYMHIVTISAIAVTLFLGGWQPIDAITPDFAPALWRVVWFLLKTSFVRVPVLLAARDDAAAALRPADEPRVEAADPARDGVDPAVGGDA